MYFFINESGKLTDKQGKLLDIISLKFSDLAISYDKVTETPLRTADILTHDAILENKYKAIIAVGSDKVASQVINAITKLKHANKQIKNWPVFGMVPLQESKIANVLGLPQGDKICEVLTSRKIETFDLGRADGNYFLTSFDIDILERKKTIWKKIASAVKSLSNVELPEVELVIDKQFEIKTKMSTLSVVNSLIDIGLEDKNKINLSEIGPKDGMLDVVMYSSARNRTTGTDLSFFRGKSITFYCKKKLVMYYDDQPIKKVPEKFVIVPRALEAIVGKRRKF